MKIFQSSLLINFNMKTKKFKYNDKLREIIVLEESPNNIKGIDMSYFSEDEKKSWQKIQEDFDPLRWEGDKKDSDEGKSELLKIKPYMKHFRNFSKNKIS